MSTLTGGPGLITNGLVLYLDAANPASYISGSLNWNDLSRNNSSGSLINGPTFNTGSGGSIVFNGSNNYVDFGNLGTIGNNQTVEVWFNSTSVVNYKNILDMNYLTYSPTTGNVGPRLEQQTNGYLTWYWSGNTTDNNTRNSAIVTTNLIVNTWYQAVFTLTSGAFILYLNGTQTNSGTSPQGYITTYGSVNLGRGFVLDSSRYFTGSESILRIYNRTLTTDEVLQNYNAQKSRFGL
jgi:hypothetical protein